MHTRLPACIDNADTNSGAAEHVTPLNVQRRCLLCRVAPAGIMDSRCQLQQPRHLPRLGAVSRLATFDAASLPPGSGERLADILAHCQIVLTTLQTCSVPDEAARASAVTQQMLAHASLADTLVALGRIHR